MDIFIDGVRVKAEVVEEAMILADATGRTHFAGYAWEMDPERPGWHRDTDRMVVSDNHEVMLANCGSFVWVPPARGLRAVV
jgi:hypothetical protein